MNRLTRRAALGAAAAFTIAPSARAQAYPAKPMRFLVPYPVGGIVDIVTYCLAEPMQVDLGQPVVVEPKPGGNSTLATAMIPQAPADGYNWLMATISHSSCRICNPCPTTLWPTSSRSHWSPWRPRSQRSIRRCRRRPSRSWSSTAAPIPASSTISTPATARRSICRPSF